MTATPLPCGPLANGRRVLVLHIEPGSRITVGELLADLARDAGIDPARMLFMRASEFAEATVQRRIRA